MRTSSAGLRRHRGRREQLGCVPGLPHATFPPTTTSAPVPAQSPTAAASSSRCRRVVRRFADDRRTYGYFLDGDFDATTLVNRMTQGLKYSAGALSRYARRRRRRAQEGEIGLGWLDEVGRPRRFDMRPRSSARRTWAFRPRRTPKFVGTLDTLEADSSSVIQYDLSWAARPSSRCGCTCRSTRLVVGTSACSRSHVLPGQHLHLPRLLRVSYLGNIQILSVFVVLGVGADDVSSSSTRSNSRVRTDEHSGTPWPRDVHGASRPGDIRHSFTTMMMLMAMGDAG